MKYIHGEAAPLFCFLAFCSLRGNMLSAEGVCALVRVFQVNKSLQKLKLGWVQPFSSSFWGMYIHLNRSVITSPVLKYWETLESICMDSCVHCWQTPECAHQYIYCLTTRNHCVALFSLYKCIYKQVPIPVHAPSPRFDSSNLHHGISHVHIHQSFFGLGHKAFPIAVHICQELLNLPSSFIHLRMLLLSTSMWHRDLSAWNWLYTLALRGFGLGVKLAQR